MHKVSVSTTAVPSITTLYMHSLGVICHATDGPQPQNWSPWTICAWSRMVPQVPGPYKYMAAMDDLPGPSMAP